MDELTPAPKIPLTRKTATFKAKTTLVEMKSKHDLVLQENETIEKPFGWVFFYNTRRYLETNNPQFLVPGIGPFIIETTGEVTFLSTASPPAATIAAWEKEWLEKHGKSPNQK